MSADEKPKTIKTKTKVMITQIPDAIERNRLLFPSVYTVQCVRQAVTHAFQSRITAPPPPLTTSTKVSHVSCHLLCMCHSTAGNYPSVCITFRRTTILRFRVMISLRRNISMVHDTGMTIDLTRIII